MTKNIYKNVFFNLFQSVINLIINLVIRMMVLKYIGVELLGVNATINSIVGAMALTELGANTVIIYYMYKPLINNDFESINFYLNAFKLIYRIVAFVILFLAILFYPFLHFFLVGVDVNSDIRIMYWLIIANSFFSYFFSYRKIIFEADQKQYIIRGVEFASEILSFFVELYLLCIVRNYNFFLLIVLLKNILSNLYIDIYAKKEYCFLTNIRIAIDKLTFLGRELKKAFFIRIASYIYTGTDNIIISCFINTVSVGYFVNYSQIFQAVISVIRAVIYSLSASLGIEINSADSKSFAFYEKYLFFSFCMGVAFLIPTYVLIDDFVILLYGKEYVLAPIVSFMLVSELFLDCLQVPMCAWIYAEGKFEIENRNCIVGASLNIIFSICLVRFWGITGVLFGTLLSQFIFIMLRNKSVQSSAYFISSYKKNISKKLVKMSIVFICILLLMKIVYMIVPITTLIFKMIVGLIVCELLSSVFVVCLFNGDIISFLKK